MAKQSKRHQSTILNFTHPLTFLGGILLILAIGAWASLKTLQKPSIYQVDNPTGSTTLSLSPDPLEIEANSAGTLNLNIDTGNSYLAAVMIELSYDPSKLTINSITQGDFLTETLQEPIIDSDNGLINFDYSTSLDNPDGVSGTGTLATINLTSTDQDSTLSFTTQTMTITPSSEQDPLNNLLKATDSNITIVTSDTGDTGDTGDDNNDDPLLTTPTLSLKYDPTCTNIPLSWAQVAQAPGFNLDLSESSDFTNFKSAPKLAGDTTSYTFTNLKEATTYYARLTLTDIPDFPQFSNILTTNTNDCTPTQDDNDNNDSTPTPTPTPTNTPSSTPTPPPSSTIKLVSSPLPSPTYTTDNSSFGKLNDIFTKSPDDNQAAASQEPNFFKKILLGWLAIFKLIFKR